MPFRNGLRHADRAVIGWSAPGREAPFEVPPAGLRELRGESAVGRHPVPWGEYAGRESLTGGNRGNGTALTGRSRFGEHEGPRGSSKYSAFIAFQRYVVHSSGQV